MEAKQKSGEIHGPPADTTESLGAVSIAGATPESTQTADMSPVKTVSWGRPLSPPYTSERGIATVGLTGNEVRQGLGQK